MKRSQLEPSPEPTHRTNPAPPKQTLTTAGGLPREWPQPGSQARHGADPDLSSSDRMSDSPVYRRGADRGGADRGGHGPGLVNQT